MVAPFSLCAQTRTDVEERAVRGRSALTSGVLLGLCVSYCTGSCKQTRPILCKLCCLLSVSVICRDEKKFKPCLHEKYLCDVTKGHGSPQLLGLSVTIGSGRCWLLPLIPNLNWPALIGSCSVFLFRRMQTQGLIRYFMEIFCLIN